MKLNRFLKLICSVGLCFLLTGCSINYSPSADTDTKKLSTEELELIQNADTVYDIAELFTGKTKRDELQYSECDRNPPFSMYFELLGLKEYFIVDYDHEKYLLFDYAYVDYTSKMTSITGINKNYNADHLSLSVTYRTKSEPNIGCFPSISSARCILKLDQEITSLTVNNTPYTPYDGGYVHIGDLYGVADAELNIIVPIQYTLITDLDTYETDQHYYRMTTKQGAGLMDENFQVLLQPQYDNIFFLYDNQFIVTRGVRSGTGLVGSEIGIVDSEENLLYGYIDGFINGDEHFYRDVHQMVFGRMVGDDYLEGVIDDHLNIIIEPQYEAVSVFEIGREDDRFYVVENQREEFAVIDSSGNQQTAFEKSSVYDVQTAYYQALGGH